MKRLKIRARLEFAVAVVAGILGILSIFWRDWIEALTGWDPDQHSGAAEWFIVVALLTVSVLVGLAGRRDWCEIAHRRRDGFALLCGRGTWSALTTCRRS